MSVRRLKEIGVGPILAIPNLWLGALGVLHLLLFLYYFPLPDLLNSAPLRRADYATHTYNAITAAKLLERFGHTWGYDPTFMAGYPIGTVFDVDNKPAVFWVRGFGFLGPALAFKLWVALLFLGLPAAVYATARLLGLGTWERVAAVGMGLLVWRFDPSAYTMYFAGMFAFASAAYLAPLALACLCFSGQTARRALVLARP